MKCNFVPVVLKGKTDEMARSLISMGLAVGMLGILMSGLHTSKAESNFEKEKRSCHGAFDLYFVLDK